MGEVCKGEMDRTCRIVSGQGKNHIGLLKKHKIGYQPRCCNPANINAEGSK